MRKQTSISTFDYPGKTRNKSNNSILSLEYLTYIDALIYDKRGTLCGSQVGNPIYKAQIKHTQKVDTTTVNACTYGQSTILGSPCPTWRITDSQQPGSLEPCDWVACLVSGNPRCREAALLIWFDLPLHKEKLGLRCKEDRG